MDERLLEYDAFDPAEEGLREALTSTGNGYFCARGTAEWEDAGRRPLPGHVRARPVQPRDDDHGRAPGPQRGSRQPAELARAEAEDRGRGRDPARQRRAAGVPPRLRHRHGDGDPRAALPRPRRARDDAAQPALREHGALPPGGDRVDADGRRTGRAASRSCRRSTAASRTPAWPATARSRDATSTRSPRVRSGRR